MSAVALVGLGRMGRSLCARLAHCGYEVTATDARPELAAEARRMGAQWAPSAAEAAEGAVFVVSSLPGPEEVAAVAGELDRVLEHSGACWVEMSTAVPATAAAFGGHAVVDAPVGGGPAEAHAGRLLAYAGGRAQALRRARPLLDALCERVLHVGAPGSGYAVKLLVNALWFTHAAATAEVVALGERLGVEPPIVAEALRAGPAGSRFVELDLPRLLSGDTMPDFDLAGCCRELDDALALAAAADGFHPRTLAAVAELHQEALAHYGAVNGELLGARYVLEGRTQPRKERSRAWRSSASASSRSSSSS